MGLESLLAEQIIGLSEAIDDRTASLLVAGTGITLTYNDAAGTLTIAASSTGIGGSTGSTDNAVLRADGTGGATLQNSAFVIPDIATASPNNTVNHASIQATGATTNVSASVVPKGSGAFMLAVPDGTSTGGNARGANAVDLRIATRSSASDVASGSASFLGPNGASATGTGSVAFGGSASGANTFCLGPASNSASGGVCLGVGTEGANSASGVGSVVLSGRYNGVAGNYAMVGGQSCGASGVASLAFGESCSTTSGEPFSFAWGTFAVARLENEYSQASGRFAASGDCQFLRHVLRATSTTNTAVELLFGQSRNKRLTIPTGYVFHGTVTITGIKSDGSAIASYMRQVTIVRISNSTSISGTVNTIGSDQASGTSITIDADDTNESLRIRCTGVTSETWRWQAVVQGGLMAFGV